MAMTQTEYLGWTLVRSRVQFRDGQQWRVETRSDPEGVRADVECWRPVPSKIQGGRGFLRSPEHSMGAHLFAFA